ncbi:MAG TPA: recombinase RecT [Polyangiaceae bacterium]
MSNDKIEANAIVLRREDTFSRALEPTTWDAAMECGRAIHKAGIGGVKSPEDAVIRIMAGREIGLGAMASLRLVYSINGKVGYDAALIRARALQHPDCEYFEPDGEITATAATFKAKRKGRPEQRATFTIEDAARAQLATKDVWKAYPRNMLAARATVNLARLVFPEAVAGMHTVDELVGYTAADPGNDPTPPSIIDAVIEDAEPKAPPLPDFEAMLGKAETLEDLFAVAVEVEKEVKSGRIDADRRKAIGKAYKTRETALKTPANGATAS